MFITTRQSQVQAMWPGTGLLLLATYFHAGFLLGLFFDPEDGGDMFIRNVR
jgi:hypothetical protein